MKQIKLIANVLILFSLLCASACSGATPAQSQEKPAAAVPPQSKTNLVPVQPAASTPSPDESPASPAQPAAPAGDSQPAVLLFGIGMHIEPFGAVPSTLAVGNTNPKPQASGQSKIGQDGKRQPDYHQEFFFERHVDSIRTVAAIIEKHSGKLTVQAQTPFTQMAVSSGNTVLADLAQSGHEMALHFHEDAHLGKASESLSIDTWCAVMKEEIALVKQASGMNSIRYWSGGNLYPGVFDAAACAGLNVNSDWKNPETQSTPDELIGLHPWRPAGGTDGQDLSQITQNDPQGAIVFLPEGLYSRGDFASMRRSEQSGGDQAYFDFLEQSLLNSLAAAQPGQVNVFHFTIHAGEFLGDPEHPFEVIDRFLSEVVDPLVANGQVRWATFSEMANAYTTLEQASAGNSPSAASQPIAANPEAAVSEGYISFVINVHDWMHTGESADTLLRLVDLFEKYGVRGDFYFTAPVVEKYVQERPDLIERLKNSNMTISYHVRPPHPLYTGFDQRLQGLSDEQLRQTLLDYETYALDLSTGNLDRSRPGGYTYVAQVFGRKPVVASPLSSNPRLKSAALQIYAGLGAQMAIMYHEEGTNPAQPFDYIQGLLIRPSDFSITRVTAVNGAENFWWNYMSAPDATRYDPTRMLQAALETWQKQGYGRAPFITSLIHENNFYRSGPEAWTSVYYSLEHGKKSQPLTPPFNLDAADPSTLRSAADQAAIWQAYEALVAYASRHLRVVTSEDILQLAAQNS